MNVLAIIAAVLLFTLLIAGHEFGHYAAAKLLGVRVNEYSIGMGPLIFQKKHGETEYSLRALPIGGYCKIEGEDGDSDDDRSFMKKPWWAKVIILAADMGDIDYTRIPRQDELKIDADADYFYTCMNNTVYGSKWNYIPETNGVPIMSDISSCILSEPLDVSKFALLYAGAQKNMAPAGLTVVIVRRDMLGSPMSFTPTMLDYGAMAKAKSMYNTPPTYQIYILKLVLEWLEGLGGVEGMAAINRRKAGILYDYLDNSKFYIANVEKDSRSIMNVTYHCPTKELDAKFVAESIEMGFQNLKGYRSVGGIRASIYNAMPVEGVEALVDFMAKFEKANA